MKPNKDVGAEPGFRAREREPVRIYDFINTVFYDGASETETQLIISPLGDNNNANAFIICSRASSSSPFRLTPCSQTMNIHKK